MNMPSSFLPSPIVVFLGPSLSLEEARKILPNALYLPPVQCRDILFALRLKPGMLVIIDGFFEHTASVWHKEILFALAKKVIVAGASSMGALRAAELAEFGMIGSGQIFMDYFQGRIVDDDEVAVLHQPKEFAYQSLTDALVNIRATLLAALAEKIIDAAIMEEILNQSRQLIYSERTLVRALKLCSLEDNVLNNLESWLAAGNFVDQKKQDAIELLEKIAAQKLSSPANVLTKPNKTIFLHLLHKEVMCRPFPTQLDWLPRKEKVVLAARGLAENYPLLLRLAEALELVYSYLQSHPDSLTDDSCVDQENNKLFLIHSDVASMCWASQHDCSEDEKIIFVERMTAISKLLTACRFRAHWSEPSSYLLYAMRLFGDFDNYQSELFKEYKTVNMCQIIEFFSQQDPLRFTIMESFSLLWWFIDQQAEELELFLQTPLLQENSDSFRRQRQLLEKANMEGWLKRNELDLPEYQKFIVAISRLKLIQNQPDILHISYEEEDVFWLYEALCLTDVYRVAKSLSLR